MTLNACVFGSVTIDIICSLASSSIERISLHNATASYLMLEQGKKVDSEKISVFVGGAGANVSIALARLGHRVSIVALTGDDANADVIAARLRDESVITNYLSKRPDHDSGIGILVSAHDNDAAIFTHRGANTTLSIKEVTSAPIIGSDLVYIGPLSGESANQFANIVTRANDAGAFTVATPGIRQLTSSPDAFMSVVTGLDLLTLNSRELLALFPYLYAHTQTETAKPVTDNPLTFPRLMQSPLSTGALKSPFPAIVQAILKHGIKTLAVTDGSHGAYLASGDTLLYLPSKSVDVVGSAGAGDAFTSTLAAALATGQKPDIALARATANSASVISHLDTLTGLQDANTLLKVDQASGLMQWRLSDFVNN